MLTRTWAGNSASAARSTACWSANPHLPAMGQRDPGQRERAPAKANAHHQNGMGIAPQAAIDQQLYPLAVQPLQGRFGERLIVILLRDPRMIQQAPDALLFGGLS